MIWGKGHRDNKHKHTHTHTPLACWPYAPKHTAHHAVPGRGKKAATCFSFLCVFAEGMSGEFGRCHPANPLLCPSQRMATRRWRRWRRTILSNLLFMGRGFSFRGGGDGSVSLSISPLTSANQRPAVRLFLEGWGAGGRGDTRGFGRQWDDESDTLHCQCVVSPPACQGLVRYTTNRRSQRPHPPLSFFFFSGRLICPAASSWALGRVVVVVGVSPD